MTIPRTTTGRGFPRPSIPPPQVKARSKKRTTPCIRCGRKARKIHVVNVTTPDVKIFCSAQCATEWALDYVPKSNFLFCMDCMKWTDETGMCDCDRAAALAQVGEAIAAADRKAVQP